MRVKCPQCLHNLDLPEPAEDQVLVCPDCQTKFDRDGRLLPVPVQRGTLPAEVPPGPRYPRALDPVEYEEERLDRREERLDRQESREYRREDREYRREDRVEGKERNVLGIIGFTVGLCSLLFVGGGMLFAQALPFYLGMALTLSLPMAIVSLVCSLLGVFMRRTMRPLALAGAFIGAILLLVVIPAGYLMIKWS